MDLKLVENKKIKGNCTCESYNDHRIAMSLAIAGLIAENPPININDFDCVNISYPRFLDTLNTLR